MTDYARSILEQKRTSLEAEIKWEIERYDILISKTSEILTHLDDLRRRCAEIDRALA